MRILIIDTNIQRRRSFKRILQQNLFIVEIKASGAKGMEAAQSGNFDVVVVSERAFRGDAVTFCRELRSVGKTFPILVISKGDDSSERSVCLQAGADDCLREPIHLNEFVARVRALLRRSPVIHDKRIVVKGISIDAHTQKVSLRGTEVHLTAKEYVILEVLSENRGCVVSKEQLVEKVWGTTGRDYTRSLEAHISNLRRKLGSGRKPVIETLTGRGYRLG